MKLSFLILFLLFNCSNKGEFGWATTSDEEKSILEKEIYNVTDFKMTRKNLVFLPHETIHYIYSFESSPGENEYVVRLEKESLGFVEIDLKKKFIEPETTSIKDRFSNLGVGKYRLQIVYEENVIDSIEFDVISSEGYPLKEEISEIDDDIIKYSK